MSNERNFVILDGNSLMHRAFHALPALSNEDGIFTNAVFGFLSMFLKVVSDFDPAYIAVAFDLKGSTFRHKDYSAYKGTRKPTAPELIPQFDLISNALEAMHVKKITCPSFEADDILGTMARRCEEAGIPAILVTGDRDSMQLVSQQTRVLYTKRGVTEVVLYTPDLVEKDFGVPPLRIPDLKGLMGDSSDNIPGIPGIGEKTAVKFLQTYGSLEEVLAHAAQDLKGKTQEKVINGTDSAILSKKLATITREVPLDDVSIEDCKRHSFMDGIPYLETLGMKSIISRIEKLEGSVETEKPHAPETVVFSDEQLLTNASAIKDYLVSAPDDCKTALVVLEDTITLARTDGTRARIPLMSSLLSINELPLDDAFSALRPLFEGDQSVILYGAKRLMTDLAKFGLTLRAPFEDDQILQYLLAPQKGKYEVSEDASALLNRTAADLSLCTQQDMEKLYREIELPLSRTLFDMEREGFLVDIDTLRMLGDSFTEQINALKSDIYTLAGNDQFNINSTQQLGDILFNKLGLPATKKTKSGYSTSAEVLQELADQHPIIGKILQYRQVTKLNSTYIDGLLALTDRDSRIHSWFDQTIAATGRISSSEPNLQNIPVRSDLGREIRRAFIAKDGCVLIDADYSQIELRLLAHLSDDQAMIDAFLKGQDIHARTAAEVYGIPIEEVTPKMRSSAKAVNFGIVYGISEFGLAANLHISRYEAKQFINKYFERYPAIRRYMDLCVSQGKTNGYSVTLYGRRRPLPELSSPNYNMRQFGERAAMNTPVQGTAADIIKIAMNTVHERLASEGLKARLILQVHDELIVETPLEEQDRVTSLLRECMENAASLSVPLTVEINAGHTWFESK
ncbi:MAG: DNA polymerase I [Clostridia bacterium]|nr:DNA polymerase I [Clostridia bacterium]